jgi:UDP-glucose 4-epimerase
MSKTKVLVTGGAGFIGSSIANRLLRESGINSSSEVIVLDDLSLGTPSHLSKEIEFVEGSVMDYDLVLGLTKECNYVFHEAARSSSPMFTNDPRRGIDVNVIGFMNVMEASKKNNVKKVIFASSSSLYNGQSMPFKESYNLTPKTFYEVSFFCREAIAKSYYLESGLNSIGLRYFSVYGYNEKHKGNFANNISQFLWSIQEGKTPVIFGDGLQTRDFTFIEDVVDANILAMNSEIEHGIYNIGDGISTSFNEVVRLLNKHLGTNTNPDYMANPIKNYVQDTMADTSLAKSKLGYQAKWNIEDGIRALITKSHDKETYELHSSLQ